MPSTPLIYGSNAAAKKGVLGNPAWGNVFVIGDSIVTDWFPYYGTACKAPIKGFFVDAGAGNCGGFFQSLSAPTGGTNNDYLPRQGNGSVSLASSAAIGATSISVNVTNGWWNGANGFGGQPAAGMQIIVGSGGNTESTTIKNGWTLPGTFSTPITISLTNALSLSHASGELAAWSRYSNAYSFHSVRETTVAAGQVYSAPSNEFFNRIWEVSAFSLPDGTATGSNIEAQTFFSASSSPIFGNGPVTARFLYLTGPWGHSSVDLVVMPSQTGTNLSVDGVKNVNMFSTSVSLAYTDVTSSTPTLYSSSTPPNAIMRFPATTIGSGGCVVAPLGVLFYNPTRSGLVLVNGSVGGYQAVDYVDTRNMSDTALPQWLAALGTDTLWSANGVNGSGVVADSQQQLYFQQAHTRFSTASTAGITTEFLGYYTATQSTVQVNSNMRAAVDLITTAGGTAGYLDMSQIGTATCFTTASPILSDGVHPSNFGDRLVARTVESALWMQVGADQVTSPSVKDVRSGTAFGLNANSTGTLVLPNANVVLTGTTFDSITAGTLTIPTAANVRRGTTFGVGGSGSTGIAYIPTAANVRLGTNVDATTGTLSVPAASVVLTGTTFDNGTAGTLALPNASDVRQGTTFGTGGTGSTGSAYIPAASDVRSGTNVDATTGTLMVPDATDVRFGVGVDNNFGTISIPSPVIVLTGNFYDNGIEGSLTVPDEADTRNGVNYGLGGVANTGTAYIPTADSVLLGVNTDNTVGTVTLPATSDVRLGTTYGPNLSETGTLTAAATTSALQVTGSITLYDAEGNTAPAAVIEYQFVADSDTAGRSFPRTWNQATADSNGIVSIALLASATYQFRRDGGAPVTVTTPASGSFSIPEVLGRQYP